MAGVETLIAKARERLNLNCYSDWEAEFLASIVQYWDRKRRLTPKQETKLREIVLQRWVKGEKPYWKTARRG